MVATPRSGATDEPATPPGPIFDNWRMTHEVEIAVADAQIVARTASILADDLAKTKDIVAQVVELQTTLEEKEQRLGEEIESNALAKQKIRALERAHSKRCAAHEREEQSHAITRSKLAEEERSHMHARDLLLGATAELETLRNNEQTVLAKLTSAQDLLRASRTEATELRAGRAELEMRYESLRQAYEQMQGEQARYGKLREEYEHLYKQQAEAKSMLNSALFTVDAYRKECHSIQGELEVAKRDVGKHREDLARAVAENESLLEAKLFWEELLKQRAGAALERRLAMQDTAFLRENLNLWRAASHSILMSRRRQDHVMYRALREEAACSAQCLSAWAHVAVSERRARQHAASRRSTMAVLERHHSAQDADLLRIGFGSWRQAVILEVSRKNLKAERVAARLQRNHTAMQRWQMLCLSFWARRMAADRLRRRMLAFAERHVCLRRANRVRNICFEAWQHVLDLEGVEQRHRRRNLERARNKAWGQLLRGWLRTARYLRHIGTNRSKLITAIQKSLGSQDLEMRDRSFKVWKGAVVNLKSCKLRKHRFIRSIYASMQDLQNQFLSAWAGQAAAAKRHRSIRHGAANRLLSQANAMLMMQCLCTWSISVERDKLQALDQRLTQALSQSASRQTGGDQPVPLDSLVFVAWSRLTTSVRYTSLMSTSNKLQAALEEAKHASDRLADKETQVQRLEAQLQELMTCLSALKLRLLSQGRAQAVQIFNAWQDEMRNVCFGSWVSEVREQRCSRLRAAARQAAETMMGRRAHERDLALSQSCCEAWLAFTQEARARRQLKERNLMQSLRCLAASDGTLLQKCIERWRAAGADHKAQRERKELNLQRIEQRISAKEQALLGRCLLEWGAEAQALKRERKWMLYRESSLAVLLKQVHAQDLILLGKFVQSWKAFFDDIRMARQRQDHNMKRLLCSICETDYAVQTKFLAIWVHAIEEANRERQFEAALNEKAQEVKDCRSEARSLMKDRGMAYLLRMGAGADKRTKARCLFAWRLSVESSNHQQLCQHHRHKAVASLSRTIAAIEESFQARCFLSWAWVSSDARCQKFLDEAAKTQSALEAATEKANENLAMSQQEAKELGTRLEDLRKELLTIKERLEAERNRSEEIRNSLRDREMELGVLQAELEAALRVARESFTPEEVMKLRAQINTLQRQFDDTKDMLSKAKAELEAALKAAEEAGEVDRLQRQYEDKNHELEAQKRMCLETSQALQGCEAELKRARADLEAAIRADTTAEAELGKLRAMVDNLQKMCDERASLLEVQKKTYAEIEQTLQEREAELTRAKIDLERALTAAKLAGGSSAAIQDEIKKLEDEVEMLKKDCEAAKASLEVERRKLHETSADLKKVTEELRTASQAEQAANQSAARLTQIVEDREDELERLREQLDAASKAALEALQAEEQSSAELSRRLQESEAAAKQLREQLAAALRSEEDAQALRTIDAATQAQLQELRRVIEDKNKQLESEHQKHSESLKLLEEREAGLSKANAEREDALKRVEELQAQMETLTKECEDKGRQLQKIFAELATALSAAKEAAEVDRLQKQYDEKIGELEAQKRLCTETLHALQDRESQLNGAKLELEAALRAAQNAGTKSQLTEEELQQLRARVDALQAQYDERSVQLENERHSCAKMAQALQDQKLALQTANADLEKALDAARIAGESSAMIQEELKQLKDGLCAAKEEVASLRQKLQDCGKELEDVNLELEVAKAAEVSGARSREELVQQHDALQRSYEETLAELETARQSHAEALRVLEEREAALRKAQAEELQKMEAKLNELTQQIEEKELDLLSTCEKLEAAKQAVAQEVAQLELLQGQYDQKAHELEALKRTFSELSAQLESEQIAHVETSRSLESSRKDLDQTKAQLESAEQACTETSRCLEMCTTDLDQTKAQLESEKQTSAETARSLECCEADLSTTKTEAFRISEISRSRREVSRELGAQCAYRDIDKFERKFCVKCFSAWLRFAILGRCDTLRTHQKARNIEHGQRCIQANDGILQVGCFLSWVQALASSRAIKAEQRMEELQEMGSSALEGRDKFMKESTQLHGEVARLREERNHLQKALCCTEEQHAVARKANMAIEKHCVMANVDRLVSERSAACLQKARNMRYALARVSALERRVTLTILACWRAAVRYGLCERLLQTKKQQALWMLEKRLGIEDMLVEQMYLNAWCICMASAHAQHYLKEQALSRARQRIASSERFFLFRWLLLWSLAVVNGKCQAAVGAAKEAQRLLEEARQDLRDSSANESQASLKVKQLREELEAAKKQCSQLQDRLADADAVSMEAKELREEVGHLWRQRDNLKSRLADAEARCTEAAQALLQKETRVGLLQEQHLQGNVSKKARRLTKAVSRAAIVLTDDPGIQAEKQAIIYLRRQTIAQRLRVVEGFQLVRERECLVAWSHMVVARKREQAIEQKRQNYLEIVVNSTASEARALLTLCIKSWRMCSQQLRTCRIQKIRNTANLSRHIEVAAQSLIEVCLLVWCIAYNEARREHEADQFIHQAMEAERIAQDNCAHREAIVKQLRSQVEALTSQRNNLAASLKAEAAMCADKVNMLQGQLVAYESQLSKLHAGAWHESREQARKSTAVIKGANLARALAKAEDEEYKLLSRCMLSWIDCTRSATFEKLFANLQTGLDGVLQKFMFAQDFERLRTWITSWHHQAEGARANLQRKKSEKAHAIQACITAAKLFISPVFHAWTLLTDQSKIERVEEQLQEEHRIAALRDGQLSECQAEVRKSTMQLQEVWTQREDMKRRFNELEKHAADLEDALEQAYLNAEANASKAAEQVMQLQEDLEESSEECAQLQERAAAADAAIKEAKELREEVGHLWRLRDTLQSRLTDAEERCAQTLRALLQKDGLLAALQDQQSQGVVSKVPTSPKKKVHKDEMESQPEEDHSIALQRTVSQKTNVCLRRQTLAQRLRVIDSLDNVRKRDCFLSWTHMVAASKREKMSACTRKNVLAMAMNVVVQQNVAITFKIVKAWRMEIERVRMCNRQKGQNIARTLHHIRVTDRSLTKYCLVVWTWVCADARREYQAQQLLQEETSKAKVALDSFANSEQQVEQLRSEVEKLTSQRAQLMKSSKAEEQRSLNTIQLLQGQVVAHEAALSSLSAVALHESQEQARNAVKAVNMARALAKISEDECKLVSRCMILWIDFVRAARFQNLFGRVKMAWNHCLKKLVRARDVERARICLKLWYQEVTRARLNLQLKEIEKACVIEALGHAGRLFLSPVFHAWTRRTSDSCFERLQEDFRQLDGRLDVKEKELSHCQGEIRKKTTQLQEVSTQLEEMKSRFRESERRAGELQGTLEHSEARVAELECLLHELDRFRESGRRAAELEGILKQSEARVAELESLLQELDRFHDSEKRATELEGILKQSEARVAELECLLQELQQRLDVEMKRKSPTPPPPPLLPVPRPAIGIARRCVDQLDAAHRETLLVWVFFWWMRALACSKQEQLEEELASLSAANSSLTAENRSLASAHSLHEELERLQAELARSRELQNQAVLGQRAAELKQEALERALKMREAQLRHSCAQLSLSRTELDLSQSRVLQTMKESMMERAMAKIAENEFITRALCFIAWVLAWEGTRRSRAHNSSKSSATDGVTENDKMAERLIQLASAPRSRGANTSMGFFTAGALAAQASHAVVRTPKDPRRRVDCSRWQPRTSDPSESTVQLPPHGQDLLQNTLLPTDLAIGTGASDRNTSQPLTLSSPQAAMLPMAPPGRRTSSSRPQGLGREQSQVNASPAVALPALTPRSTTPGNAGDGKLATEPKGTVRYPPVTTPRERGAVSGAPIAMPRERGSLNGSSSTTQGPDPRRSQSAMSHW